ncbi:MAG: DUF3089 domain-containing protein [Vicinamibacterales bacterium]|nr:DUF3089 domain-containing protein [Vicinamibacterales bacterium]
MKTKKSLSTLLIVAASVFMPSNAKAQEPEPNDYADGATWLCRPGRQDACAVDLNTTVIGADGTLSLERWSSDPSAPIDCFYVYPTVSTDQSTNSNMTPDEAELRVIEQQFARFASACRPYAPSYRQVTLVGLMAMFAGGGLRDLEQGLAYNDVRDAFHHYLEHDNGGRDFVLIGHSQGSYILTRLIRDEIEGHPAQDKMISAFLLGSTVTVAAGEDTGGSFQNIPLCRSAGQTGCVITYASFRSTAPPPQNTLFGQTLEPTLTGACTNPAALEGGSSETHAYLSSGGATIAGPRRTSPWVLSGAAVETPFVSVPGLLSAECTSNEHATYLEITVHGDPSDDRVDDIVGDITPQWGLHLVDVNLAMGDLVQIVQEQTAAWEERR